MMKVLLTFIAAVIFLLPASAQHGTASNGYYPANYHGDTFKGEVTEANGDQITLTHRKGKKTTTFVGTFERACDVPKADRSPQRLTAADIPKGTVVVAFYNTETKKVDNKKSTKNIIFAIAFDVWQGQKIPDDRKILYRCSDSSFTTFQAY